MVDDRAFDAGALASGGLSMVARKTSGASSSLRCELLGDDEVYGHDDLIGEAGPPESGLPDGGLAREHEAGRFHRPAEGRDGTQLGRVEHDVGIGGEGLVTGQPALSAEVDSLGAHEHDRVEVVA